MKLASRNIQNLIFAIICVFNETIKYRFILQKHLYISEIEIYNMNALKLLLLLLSVVLSSGNKLKENYHTRNHRAAGDNVAEMDEIARSDGKLFIQLLIEIAYI